MPGARPVGLSFLFAAVALGLVGCGGDPVTVYEVPKEQPAAPAMASGSPHGGAGAGGGMGMNPAAVPPARPGLRWKTLPEGWTSQPASGMRAATFTITGTAPGSSADLAVIPLPGNGGSDLDLVNLWRGLVNLPPIEAAALPAHTSELQVGAQPVKLFSIVDTNSAEANTVTNQILVAALRQEAFTWFFRLTGPASVVPTQLENLKRFLSGVEFTAPEAAAPAAMPPMMAGGARPPGMGAGGSGGPGSGGGQPRIEWSVPDRWKSVPPTQMIHSKWTVSGPGQGTADVTVSFFPGDTGGLVMNINRWRSQVGLKEAPEAEITPLADNLEILGGKATLVDVSGAEVEDGKGRRLVGAVAKRGGQSWFFKLLGDPKTVEAERAAFVKFVQTAQLPR